ncbi:MAG: hypothetical protein ACJARP_002422 [Vicingaceae bacterium]|jgi:hypothetical protein
MLLCFIAYRKQSLKHSIAELVAHNYENTFIKT